MEKTAADWTDKGNMYLNMQGSVQSVCRFCEIVFQKLV